MLNHFFVLSQAKPTTPVLSPITPVPRSNNPSPNFQIPEPSLAQADIDRKNSLSSSLVPPPPLNAKNTAKTLENIAHGEKEINGKLLKSRGSIINNDDSKLLKKSRSSSIKNNYNSSDGKLLESRGTIDNGNNDNEEDTSNNINGNYDVQKTTLRNDAGESIRRESSDTTTINDGAVKSERRKKSRKKSKKKSGKPPGDEEPPSLPPLRGGGGKLPPLTSGLIAATDSTI